MGKISRGGFLKTLFAASSLPLAGSAAAHPDPAQARWHSPGLGMLPVLVQAESRQVSPENPTGGKSMGARAIPNPKDPHSPFSAAAEDSGQGWKVSPFVKPQAGEPLTIMDVEGPGIIEHIRIATETSWVGNGRAWMTILLGS